MLPTAIRVPTAAPAKRGPISSISPTMVQEEEAQQDSAEKVEELDAHEADDQPHG